MICIAINTESSGGTIVKKIIFLLSLMLFAMTNVAFADEKKPKEEPPESDQMIIVNKSLNKLAFYEDGRLVHVFSVATGASASSTPEGDFHVTVKWECPVYYKGKNGPCETGNPLGPRWIGLDVPGTVGYTYGIHGNASAWSIGTYASAGCVRMHNWQVTQLFEIVKLNTPVTIIRSNKTFDEIAEEKGYTVKKSEKKQERAMIVGKTTTYYGAHEGLVLDGETLENKKVVVKESIGEWKYVETEDKEKQHYWVNTQNIVTGEVIEEKTYLLLQTASNIYTYPTEKSTTKKLEKPVILASTLHVGEWYYVALTNKKSAWIHVNQAEKVTEKEWTTQENMPIYAQEWLENWQVFENDSTDFWLLVKELLL